MQNNRFCYFCSEKDAYWHANVGSKFEHLVWTNFLLSYIIKRYLIFNFKAIFFRIWSLLDWCCFLCYVTWSDYRQRGYYRPRICWLLAYPDRRFTCRIVVSLWKFAVCIKMPSYSSYLLNDPWPLLFIRQLSFNSINRRTL